MIAYNMLKVRRNKPINKQLNEKFGGYLKHIPFYSTWVCEELNARACYVADGEYDINGNYTPLPKTLKRLTIYGLKQGVTYL